MAHNPYTLAFGREPLQVVPRTGLISTIVDAFSSENSLARIFKAAKINLSFFGFGVSLENTVPITDIELALQKMLESLKKHGKRVLASIDEAANTAPLRIFASAYQILMRLGLPIYLLMTGLFENIRMLQDEKTLTFLYRAPRIEIHPLNTAAMASNYEQNLKVSPDQALAMARMTKGYSFAFQVLGYFTWEQGAFDGTAVANFKHYLDDYAYEKIWAELSKNDRQVCHAIATSENGQIALVREILGWETNQFNPYRDRLIKRGIIDGRTRGWVSFTLPLFERYVLEHC